MLFNSYEFLLIFLPLTLVGFHLGAIYRGNRSAGNFLTIASMVFYAWWNPLMLPVILILMLVNYAFIKSILANPLNSQIRKVIMIAGIAFNLGIIGYFKYTNFIIGNINALGANVSLLNIVMPLGISFFIFQKIALIVDAWRGEIKEIKPEHFFLFVLFFPQLIAGPIVLYHEISPQLKEEGRLKLTALNLGLGLTIFALGLAQKVGLADWMEGFATPVFNAAAKGTILSPAESWVGAICYSLQLYFDFSGYSDMAIGLAKMFGIDLPLNFNSPYKSRNITEFWRRWHITLSRLLRIYLYIPLGGNRCAPIRQFFNLVIVMFLGGLWHGAAWTFVFWGLLHGLYLAINHAWQKLKPPSPLPWLTDKIAWGLTLLAITIAWVFFRAENFSAAITIIKGMFMFSSESGFGRKIIPESNSVWQWIGICAVIALFAPNTQEIIKKHFQPNLTWGVYTALALSIGILGFTRPQVFIYFQF